MKDLLHTFAQKVSVAPSRAVHVLSGEDKLNYFVSLTEFQKFCLFWVAGIILDVLKAKLDNAHSFMIET